MFMINAIMKYVHIITRRIHVYSVNIIQPFSSCISLKGCDSYVQVKCSDFNSHYKWNNYLAVNNIY